VTGIDVDVLFAGIPVREFGSARDWYERFFGRPADVIAHDTEVMWRVSDHGWLYIVQDPGHAGSSLTAMAVSDIEVTLSGLAARGVAAGQIEAQGDAAQKAVVSDPDGNTIAIIQVTAPPG
jgi:predicted enzyme related to lactoylglutathione lyase